MDDPILRCDEPAAADALLIGAGYDGTASFEKGTVDGPRAILDCLPQIELYDRVCGFAPCERLAISYVEAAGLASLAPREMVDRLAELYARFDKPFRLLLGGEHSVTNAPLRAFAGRADEITVVQIDAHADLREDDSDYAERPAGPYAHCSVMKRAFDHGYRLVQIGVRAYSAAERALFDEPRIRVFEWSGNPPAVERMLDAIPTRDVYLTIDVDGLDPAVMPATGTPVPGGLDWYTTIELLDTLTLRHRLVGADIVEVAPRAGDRRTEYNAAQLAYTLLGLASR